jgi:hypothetical protein
LCDAEKEVAGRPEEEKASARVDKEEDWRKERTCVGFDRV